MLLSRKFVSDYIDLSPNLTIEEIAEDMTNVGNEYDNASPLIECTNLIVGEVLECIPHPNSNHLHICKVNIGSELLNIVCGAPNVRVGLKVIVALPGAKLPGGEIKKSIIRGIESNGMLCSIKELGLNTKFLTEEDIEGIHELPQETPIGKDPIKVLELDDEVIDFELTSNRGDLLSILGMAYELGAIYNQKVKDIEINYTENKENIKNEFNIDIITPDCTLFLAKKIKNITIKESPNFIKNRLIASGIRPINNIVDISNYVMLETGQPLHFYDADKLGDTLIVRNAKENEKLTTLDNIERTLTPNDIVIANKKETVALAGVMGGLSTEVENNTKNIIIESAIFNNIKVRKTSKRILRSESSNRFEKGLDPKRTYLAIERSCTLLQKYADAQIVSNILSYDKEDKKEKIIFITASKINKILGIEIPHEKIISIFQSLAFKVEVNKDQIKVIVPTRRLDINIEEDLVEEVGRIYGMDNIQGKLPVFKSQLGSFNKTKRAIKNKLADLGLNETLSYSLISNTEVHKYTTDNFEEIMLADPMSAERNTLRYSLIPSLKEIYDYNIARNNFDISIFEIGKSFYKTNNKYQENLKLAILMSGNYYLDIEKTKVDFYILKGIVEELLDFLGFSNRYSFITGTLPKELHPGQSAFINVQGNNIGIIGKIHPNITKKDIYIFEIDLDQLLSLHPSKMIYKDIPKYPSIIKDVAFCIDKKIYSEEIEKTINKAGGKILTNIEVFDVYTGTNVPSNQKSIAYKLTFMDPNQTLTDEIVMEVFNKIITEVEKKFNATLRDN